MIGTVILTLLMVGTPARVPAPAPQQADMFTGSDACKDCHPDQFRAWAATKHANALDLLSQADRESGKCIRCHVTDSAEMLASSGQDPKFPNVQCESCHGAARRHLEAAHSGDATVSRTVSIDEGTCTRCHNPESPSYQPFVYPAMVRLVHPVR